MSRHRIRLRSLTGREDLKAQYEALSPVGRWWVDKKVRFFKAALDEQRRRDAKRTYRDSSR